MGVHEKRVDLSKVSDLRRFFFKSVKISSFRDSFEFSVDGERTSLSTRLLRYLRGTFLQ